MMSLPDMIGQLLGNYFSKQPQGSADGQPTPTPGSAPGPMPTPGPTSVGATDTGGWNIANRPRVNFIGGSDMAIGNGDQHWSQIGEAADFLRHNNLPPMSPSEWVQALGITMKEDLMMQLGHMLGRGSSFPIFNVQGDPFNNNVRELNLPHNAPLTGDRLYWKERAL